VPERADTSPNLTAQGRIPSVLRFVTELFGWVAAPWALAGHSLVLAAVAVVLLIGLPTVFGTPGDKKQVPVPVAGPVTIALVVLQLVAAVLGAWFAWPAWLAVVVTVLAVAAAIAELPRWRWLLNAPSNPRS
jgi:hypothetical protein